jgi:acetate kinase
MDNETTIASGLIERIGLEQGIVTIKYSGKKIVNNLEVKDHKVAVDILLKALFENHIIETIDEIKGVGHRIVQGGEIFDSNCLINQKVVSDILDLQELAPLHNKAHVTGINAFLEVLPNTPEVAVFDTTFHRTMDEVTYLYATPYEWYTKYGIRKYGAHGTSHQYVSSICNHLLNKKDSKIIVCHLGNGASICAIRDGKCIDTSMGLTPLEGIPMGTRSGNIDPTIFGVISKKENKTIDEILNALNKESGLLGVSGISSDSRDIEDAMKSGIKRAELAFNIQVKRIVDYIASYYVLLEGLDAICFTAGIGENSSVTRKAIVDKLKVLNIYLDEDLNKLRGQNLISSKESSVKVYVIPTNEEVMIAREVIRLANLK